MALTEKQKIIVEYIRNGRGEITKKEAVQLIGNQYHNREKYVGETLSRMVKKGILCRVKLGTYKLKTYPSGITPGNSYQVSERQISLF